MTLVVLFTTGFNSKGLPSKYMISHVLLRSGYHFVGVPVKFTRVKTAEYAATISLDH